MMTRVLFLALVAIAWAVPSLAQDLPGDRIRGERLSERICAECHDVLAGGIGVSLNGAPAFQALADNSELNRLNLKLLLRTPHRDMPDIILDDIEADDIIAYILGLR